MAKQKQSFGVIIATRNIFNFELAVSARKSVLDKLDKMGFGTVIIPSDVTPTGNIVAGTGSAISFTNITTAGS